MGDTLVEQNDQVWGKSLDTWPRNKLTNPQLTGSNMKIEGSVFQVENAHTYEKDDTKCSGREDLPRKVPNRASKAQIAVTLEISSVVGAFAQIPRNPFSRSRPGDTACIFQHQCVHVCEST